jgi:cation transport ATPase
MEYNMGSILTTLVPSIVNKAMDFIGDRFKSDEEKQAIKAKLEMEVKQQVENAWNQEQQELTKRLSLDMESDSWLSKNIRPLTLIYLMLLFTLAFFRDIPEQTLELLQNLLMTVFVFYFGSRTLEKVTKMIRFK